MAHILVICATHRDRRELPRIPSGHRFTWHEFATDALEDLVAPNPRGNTTISDPCAEVERLVALARSTGADAVVSTDDYPGNALAAITAGHLRLPGTPAAVNFLCQHKYLSRLAQREVVPDAVPAFVLVDDRGGRLGYGISVVYVFTTAMHTGLLGALITLSTELWYPVYDGRTAAWGLTALNDQQVAGLLMWVPGGVVFTLVGLALFAAWLGEAERRMAIEGR